MLQPHNFISFYVISCSKAPAHAGFVNNLADYSSQLSSSEEVGGAVVGAGGGGVGCGAAVDTNHKNSFLLTIRSILNKEIVFLKTFKQTTFKLIQIESSLVNPANNGPLKSGRIMEWRSKEVL